VVQAALHAIVGAIAGARLHIDAVDAVDAQRR
jgi:hypothetical protein